RRADRGEGISRGLSGAARTRLTHLQQFDLPSDWSATAIGAAAAAWHYIFGEDQPAVVTRTVGGNATPVARRARLAAGHGAERTTKRLPSCSISVSVSESKSAMISDQEPERPSAAVRSSSAFFSTSARKLQNT